MKKVIPVIVIVILIGAGLFILRARSQREITPAEYFPEPTAAATTQETQEETFFPAATPAVGKPVTSLTLTISSPAYGVTVTSAKLTVRGKTLPKAEVFVNDVETVADGSGNFSATLTLDEGENYIIVFANDDAGNAVEKELIVNYNAGE